MKLNIKEKKENKALSRIEVIAEVVFDKATPSRHLIKDAIVKEIKSKADLTLVKQILTNFGSSKAKVVAFAYSDENVMKSLERKNLIEKNVKKVEEKKEEPKAEEAPVAEEKKEEPKAEEATPKEEAPAKEE